VVVTAGRVHQLASDALGSFLLDDLTAGVVNVSLRSGTSGMIFHRYDRAIELASDTSMTCPMIEFQQTEIPTGNNILTLFELAAHLTPQGTTFKKWRSYPIKCYIQAFVNNDLDFEDAARQAANQWMDKTGLQIFAFVDSPPDTGVTMAFRSRAEMGIHNGITKHTNDGGGFPLKSDVDIINEFQNWDDLWLTALHEFGHTIRLGHLPAGYLMHASIQDMASDITNDEVKVVQLFLALPNELDMTPYDKTDPR
jgi:hypothetical protein